MPPIQSTERHTISSALGIAPEDTAIAQLSLVLGGLSTISTRGSLITIPIPPHLVRSDITAAFDHLPHIQIGGDATKILARRTTEHGADALEGLIVPQRGSLHARGVNQRVPYKEETSVRKVRTQPSSPVGRQGLTRASQVATALGVSTGEIPDYPTVVHKLGEALTYEHRQSKNTRADGVLYITVRSQGDATSLLEGLGFKPKESGSASVWGVLWYQRVCQHTETKSSASLAPDPQSGCQITISLGEPLSESLSVTPYSFQRPMRGLEN
jgi:hypothetical protein